MNSIDKRIQINHAIDMPKFKVEFSNNTTVVPERDIEFPNVEAARKGARKIANKLRAEGMFPFGFSDWQMTIMNADGTMIGEFPLEEHEDT
jgi:hypothetical protein